MKVQAQMELGGLDSRDVAYTPHLMSSSRVCAPVQSEGGIHGHVTAQSPWQKAVMDVVHWAAAEVGPATTSVTLGARPLILPQVLDIWGEEPMGPHRLAQLHPAKQYPSQSCSSSPGLPSPQEMLGGQHEPAQFRAALQLLCADHTASTVGFDHDGEAHAPTHDRAPPRYGLVQNWSVYF